jgi:hypothetical protein
LRSEPKQNETVALDLPFFESKIFESDATASDHRPLLTCLHGKGAVHKFRQKIVSDRERPPTVPVRTGRSKQSNFLPTVTVRTGRSQQSDFAPIVPVRTGRSQQSDFAPQPQYSRPISLRQVIGVGGWPQDTDREVIAARIREVFSEVANVEDLWAPWRLGSVAKVRFKSSRAMWAFIKANPGDSFRATTACGRKLWYSIDKTPSERLRSKRVGKFVKLFQDKLETEGRDLAYRKKAIVPDYQRGIVKFRPSSDLRPITLTGLAADGATLECKVETGVVEGTAFDASTAVDAANREE